MKRMNDKGFMLAEIIIVSAILAMALVGLFATFSKMFLDYEDRGQYESIDAIYASRSIAKYYKNSTEDYYEEIKNDYTKKNHVVHSYILKYDDDAIKELLNDTNTTLKEGYREYLKYLKNNLDFNDHSCYYFIVTELSDTCDNDGENCEEDNANVSFGYYKIH